MKIFSASSEDVEAMRTIVKNSWLELYPNKEYGITREDLLAIDWYNRAKLDKRKKEITENSPDTHTFVLKNEKKEVVGFCIALKLDDFGEIDGMYVLPELQGMGFGKKLMEKAFDWLGSDIDIILKVVVYNTHAIGFYKKMGFKETENKVVFIGTQLPGGIEIPRIEMIKKKLSNTK